MEEVARDCLEAYDDLIEKLDSLSSTVQSLHNAMEYERNAPHILDTYVTINEAIAGITCYGIKTRGRLAGRIVVAAEKKHE